MCKFIQTYVVCFVMLLSAVCSHASSALPVDFSSNVEYAKVLVAEKKFSDALAIYHKILDSYKKGIEDPLMPSAFIWGGNSCVRCGRPVDALDFYLAAVKAAHKFKDNNSEGAALCNIGIIYGLFKDYEQAIAYFEKALPLIRNNPHLLSVAYTNLCTAYCELGNREKAMENMSFQSRHPMSDSCLNKFHLLYNQGLYSRINGNPHAALRLQKLALKAIADCHTQKEVASGAYLEMAKSYDMVGQYDSAYMCLATSLDNSIKRDSPEYLKDTYEELGHHFRTLGLTDSVYKYQTLYYAISDSLFNNSHFNNVKGQINRYESTITDNLINKLKDTIWWLVTIGILILISAGTLIVYTGKLRNARMLLVRKNEDLSRQISATNMLLGDIDDSLQQPRQTADYNPFEDFADDNSKSTPEGIEKQTKHNKVNLLNKIQQTMVKVEIISDPDFSLQRLASLIGSNTTYVSSVINETYGKNFKTFLNEYKIREACRRIADSSNSRLTLAAIASDTGFKSQNSFITNFKKVTGMTPSAYKAFVDKESSIGNNNYGLV